MVVSAACLVVVAVVIANVVRPGISLASVDVAEASKETVPPQGAVHMIITISLVPGCKIPLAISQ